MAASFAGVSFVGLPPLGSWWSICWLNDLPFGADGLPSLIVLLGLCDFPKAPIGRDALRENGEPSAGRLFGHGSILAKHRAVAGR